MGSSASALVPAASCNTTAFMGVWFVIANKPTLFETHASNAVERYKFAAQGKKHDLDIDFQCNNGDPIVSPMRSIPQNGYLMGDKSNTTRWQVSPFWPIYLDYLILEVKE
eukprot:Selendium_serpulae@DN6356_c0_g2_i7.p1